ncbi:hypothetical protein BJV82DRAFT_665267 [Fennellomyces sp. T-0311]|nr:hypothetical protein BJV82DRAFT_665267 [Fennellomyces sp. T-0311]
MVLHIDSREASHLRHAYCENGPRGLQHLILDGFLEPEDVVDVVTRNSTTLQTIDISLRYENEADGQRVDPDWDYNNLPKVNFPVLELFDFYYEYYWPLKEWIGDCPVLESLRIEFAEDDAGYSHVWTEENWWDDE